MKITAFKTLCVDVQLLFDISMEDDTIDHLGLFCCYHNIMEIVTVYKCTIDFGKDSAGVRVRDVLMLVEHLYLYMVICTVLPNMVVLVGTYKAGALYNFNYFKEDIFPPRVTNQNSYRQSTLWDSEELRLVYSQYVRIYVLQNFRIILTSVHNLYQDTITFGIKNLVNPPYCIPLVEIIPIPCQGTIQSIITEIVKDSSQALVKAKKEINEFVSNTIIMDVWTLVEENSYENLDEESLVENYRPLKIHLNSEYTRHLVQFPLSTSKAELIMNPVYSVQQKVTGLTSVWYLIKILFISSHFFDSKPYIQNLKLHDISDDKCLKRANDEVSVVGKGSNIQHPTSCSGYSKSGAISIVHRVHYRKKHSFPQHRQIFVIDRNWEHSTSSVDSFLCCGRLRSNPLEKYSNTISLNESLWSERGYSRQKSHQAKYKMLCVQNRSQHRRDDVTDTSTEFSHFKLTPKDNCYVGNLRQ